MVFSIKYEKIERLNRESTLNEKKVIIKNSYIN